MLRRTITLTDVRRLLALLCVFMAVYSCTVIVITVDKYEKVIKVSSARHESLLKNQTLQKNQTPQSHQNLQNPRHFIRPNRKLQVLLPGNPQANDTSRKYDLTAPKLNLTGPTVNPAPEEVRWVEDLSGERQVCTGANQPFILAVVPSAVHNFKQRHRIRRTWANATLYPYTGIRAIFVLGATTNDTLQELVREEMARHRDIIQNTFIDSYRNLTYKSIAWLSWVNEWCQDTPYIAKVDDDVVVNPFNLYKFLHGKRDYNQDLNIIYGCLRKKTKPHRKGKWMVTEEEYSGNLYPPFVLGPAYIVGRKAVGSLVQGAKYTPHFWLEDVFTTGMVARAVGVKRVQTERLLFTNKRTRRLHQSAAFYVGGGEKKMRSAWRDILKYSECCKALVKEWDKSPLL